MKKMLSVIIIGTLCFSMFSVLAPNIKATDLGSWATKTSMPTPRLGLAAITYGGKIYAIGGSDRSGGGTERPTAIVEIYDRATDTWTTGTSMPAPKYHTGAVVVGDKIYVMGHDDRLFSYDPVLDAWAEHAPVPADATYGFGIGVVNGKIYAVKGSPYYPSGDCWTYCYDPLSDTWTSKAPLPFTRSTDSLATLNGKLYAIGGIEPTGGWVHCTRVDIYDPETDSWELDSIARLSIPRTHLEADTPVVNGKIYVIGGWNGYTALSTVEEYDPAADSWQTLASMPTARYALATAVFNNRIYALGGDWGGLGGHIQSVNEEFTPPGWTPSSEPTIEWASTTSLPGMRAQHASVAYNGRIYVLGGWVYAGNDTVYYGNVNLDGTIDSWHSTTSLPEQRSETVAVAYNNFVYLLGGQGPRPPYRIERDTVYYAPINPDGSLGDWSTTTPLPEMQSGHGAFIWNSRVYVVGGWTGYSFRRETYFAEIQPDGTLGSWTLTSLLPGARGHGLAAVAHNGYAYALGGSYYTAMPEVWFAKINPDGTLDPWTPAESMPQPLSTQGAAVMNDHIYVIGGESQTMSPSQRAEVFRTSVNSDGSLGGWVGDTDLALPVVAAPRAHLLQTPVWNNRIYVTGGDDQTGAVTNTVYYSRTPSTAIDIDPDTLNLRSRGNWITAYIQLPEGYSAADIDASAILLNDTISPVLDPQYDFVTDPNEYLVDHDGDGMLERMVKFDRATVQLFIYDQGFRNCDIALTITGKLFDDTTFEGTDIITVVTNAPFKH